MLNETFSVIFKHRDESMWKPKLWWKLEIEFAPRNDCAPFFITYFCTNNQFSVAFKHRNHMVDFLEKNRGFFVRLLAREECIDCFFSIVPPFFCHRTIERGAFTFIMKSLNESRKYFGTVSNYPFSILAAAKKKTFIDSHIRGGWKPYKNVTLWSYVTFMKVHTGCPNKFWILILAYFTLYKCHIYEGMAVFHDIFCP